MRGGGERARINHGSSGMKQPGYWILEEAQKTKGDARSLGLVPTKKRVTKSDQIIKKSNDFNGLELGTSECRWDPGKMSLLVTRFANQSSDSPFRWDWER